MTREDTAALRLFEQPYADLDPAQRAIVRGSLEEPAPGNLLDSLIHRIATGPVES